MRHPRILVLYRHSPGKGSMRLAVERHLRVLDGGEEDLVYVNASEQSGAEVREQVFDAVVLHTTFLGLRWNRKFEMRRRDWDWIGALEAPKVALPQDEYRLAHVLDDWLVDLGVEHVFSVFEGPSLQLLYPRMSQRASFSKVLTGYIDEEAAAHCRTISHPLSERPLDIVYRSAPTRFWLGSHGLLKPAIGETVLERAGSHALAVDISTSPEDTIQGRGWLDFLASGRATVGAEGGSSVLDPRGEVRARVEQLLGEHPGMTFAELDAAMPAGWDQYEFFASGPRHLEAVITRTAQVLVEGAYDGVLEPGRHYIPVKRDFADLDEVLELLRDVGTLERLVDCAYEEVYLSGRWTTRALGAQIRDVLALSERRSARRVWSIARLGRRIVGSP